jgi:hypothetical protein
VQRQLPFDMVLEVAYIGSHAMHLLINTQLDYVPRQFLSTSLVRDTSANTLLSSYPTNAAFGTISSQANTPRRVESGLRLVW